MESAGDAQIYRKVTHVEKSGSARVESVADLIDYRYQKSSRTVNEYGYLVDTIAKRRALKHTSVFWAASYKSAGEVCPKEAVAC